MKPVIEREYITPDFALNEDGNLMRWTCHWSFSVREEGGVYIRRSSYELAPGSRARHRSKRTVTEGEAAKIVRQLQENVDTSPLFTRVGG